MRFCCGVPSGTSRTNWLTDAVARNAEQEVRLLAEELYSTSASRQLQGLHRLVELTAHSDIYRGVCPAAHVLPPLGKMIENAEQEPESGVLAAKALANITKCSSTHRHLITAGAVPVLLGLLDHASCHTSTRCAMQALRNLTASQPVAVLQTADAAQLMSKVERRVMASAEASVQQAGAQLLLNLSAASMQRPTQSLLLGSVGWVASLVRILQDRIGLDLEARDMLVETLLNLTQECRTNRQLMVEEGGLDLVFCIARSSDCSPAVWVAVVSLFRALASDGWAAELVDGGAVELVLQLLRASEPDDDRFCPALVKEEAALALQHLSHADDSARLRSIQVGAVQELLSTITTTSTVGHCVVIAACQALYAICMTRAGQQAVLSQQALPVIVATLRDELQRRSADSQDCESLVLLVRRLVCHGAPQAVPQLVQEAGLPVFVDLLHSASGRSATKRHAFSILVGVSSFRDHRFKEHFGVRAVYMAGALPVLSKLLYQASRPRPSSGSKGQPSGGLAVADCWQWVSWTAHMLHQMLEDPTLQAAVLQQLTRHRLSHVRRLARQSCRGLQELLQNMARDSQPEFLLFEPKPLPGPRPPPGVLPQRCNGASHSRLG